MSLETIVRQFRKGLLGRRKPKGRCWMVCAPLVSYLELLGHEAQLTEGYVKKEHHFWIKLSGNRIIDPTADQFSRLMPSVYIGKQPAWYKESKGNKGVKTK